MSQTTRNSRTGSRARVIIHLGGGLGNQMFQYAFGRRMSVANDADLHIDASGYANILTPQPATGVRTLALQHFGIHGTMILRRPGVTQPTTWVRRKILKHWNRGRALWESRKPYRLRREVWEPEENHFRFDRGLYERPITGTVDFYGYWQTERYFSDIEAVLRKELVVVDPMDQEAAQLARLIESVNSVSIHIRHGDNANVAAAALGVLPVDYYERAIVELSREVSQPRFFVFSDDPEWARANLVLNPPAIYVSLHREARDYEDLRLMTLCKHHICANSTFSWWGAWLGKKGGQVVYAPRRYYQNIDRPNPDLYPESWRLI